VPRVFERTKRRLAHAGVGGVEWYWPADAETSATLRDADANAAARDEVRLLAPFDPVVWDRRRFELFWGWAYRFEAYTPAEKRTLGYYALPLLWREHVIGWANVSTEGGTLQVQPGYVAGHRPKDRTFTQQLDAECARLQACLGVGSASAGRIKTKRRT
jgi:hypothetical protein